MRGRKKQYILYSIEFIAVEVYKNRVVWVSKFPGCLKIRFINYSVENSSLSIILFNRLQQAEERMKEIITATPLKKTDDVEGSIQQLLVKHHK